MHRGQRPAGLSCGRRSCPGLIPYGRVAKRQCASGDAGTQQRCKLQRADVPLQMTTNEPTGHRCANLFKLLATGPIPRGEKFLVSASHAYVYAAFAPPPSFEVAFESGELHATWTQRSCARRRLKKAVCGLVRILLLPSDNSRIKRTVFFLDLVLILKDGIR